VADPVERQPKRFWWKEALIMFGFYVVYSIARNQFGSARVADGEEPVQAFRNALRVIRWERAVSSFQEEPIQELFLGWRAFLQFWNVFYGTAHFAVTMGAFVWLFRRGGRRFPAMRNALAFSTALAIVGFSLFPLMPPRLLNDDGLYGGNRLAAEQGIEHFGFTDTIEEFGGPWKFDSGAGAKVSNQYAAMPSMHIGWAAWSTWAMWPLARRRWARQLLAAYPVMTLFCIVVTGNHFVLDAVGGLVTLAIGGLLGTRFDRWNERRLGRTPPTLAVGSEPVPQYE
jgi:PAP2 superfamily